MSETRTILEKDDGLNGKPVVWELFECDKGCRWSQGKDAPFTDDGSPCLFSGCQSGHFAHFVRETGDRNEARDWFRNIHEEVEV